MLIACVFVNTELCIGNMGLSLGSHGNGSYVNDACFVS